MRSLVTLPVLASLVLFSACADSDDDGLTNGHEKRIGSDPNNPDSDGDGLLDGEEVEFGSDPTVADSDGDGYSDFSEYQEDTDPNDSSDVVFTSGWPHNPFKDDLEDPGFETDARNGDRIGRLITFDQFGEEVDLYDWAGQGKPILMDVSAQWCGPCQQMSTWLGGGNDSFYSEFNPIRDAVDNGDILWVTVLSENSAGRQPTENTTRWWDEQFPHPNIAVIADQDYAVLTQLGLTAYPSVYFLDENMVLIERAGRDNLKAMDEAMEWLEEQE